MSTPSVVSSISDRTPSPPALPVGAMLRFGLQEIRSRIYAGVRDSGFEDVRPAHVTLFRWPGPDGRRPSEVAADVQISKQRVNDLLRDLERLGYLALERDPTDRRARIIRLTARGLRLHTTAVDIHAQVEQEWRQKVGAPQYQLLRQTLAHLVGRSTTDPAQP